MSRFAGWAWLLAAWLAAGPVAKLAVIAIHGIPGVEMVEAGGVIWTPPAWLLSAAIAALLAAEFYFSWRESGRF